VSPAGHERAAEKCFLAQLLRELPQSCEEAVDFFGRVVVDEADAEEAA
jgi:hypothetical protein